MGGANIRLRIIIVVLLVAIAGCNGFMGNSGGESTPTTETNTPPQTTEEIDSDGDGLVDSRERELGTNLTSPDTDQDGLKDGPEVKKFGTDPTTIDTDGDGLEDGSEVNEYDTNATRADTDEDGIEDGIETNEYGTDPTKVDTDDDRLNDTLEIEKYGTEANESDTDGDNLSDGSEIKEYETDPTSADTDGDGLNDGTEVNQFNTKPSSADTDSDGLEDGVEVNEHSSDPTSADTDRDGLDDGVEVNEHSSDPTSADTDGDGWDDGVEVNEYGSDPTSADTDGDEIKDPNDENPLHQDIYLVIDYESGCSISSSYLSELEDKFEDAPVSNPDDRTGINLHVIEGKPDDISWREPGYYIASLEQSVTTPDGEDLDGYSPIGGDLFYVECSVSNTRKESVFMHEFGHALGIHNWVKGVDSSEVPFSQYRSIMNYNAPDSYLQYADRDWEIIANRAE